MKRRLGLGLPVILGILFYIWYIFHASDNVAYSDYIRLINSYLPDVANPAKFFVPDILTRVPITYLGRIINVKLFGYNTYFDMILGVLSLGVGAAVLALYTERNRAVGYLSFLLIQFVYFSLNKWEMMTNGTGWVCTLSISGFLFHFAVLDHAAATRCREKVDRVLLAVLPILLVVLVAGPYSGGYAVILMLTYGALWLAERRTNTEQDAETKGEATAESISGPVCEDSDAGRRCRRTWCIGALTTVLAMVLYLWSNSQAVYVHRGAVTDISISQEFAAQPLFFLRFLLKAVASSVIGVAQIQELEAGSAWFVRLHLVYLLGAAVFAAYLLALYLNVRFQLYKKTIFPLLLVLSGGCNHLLILAARWIFLKDEYGMSSRYEIQYQMGIIGILLTFALVWSAGRKKQEMEQNEEQARMPEKQAGRTLINLCMLAFAGLTLFGNVWTTRAEIRTAPYRKAYLQVSRELGLNYRTASDEDLETYLHNDPDAVREAMRILEENHLNIFR